MEVKPRTLSEPVEPGLPLEVVMFRPGTEPCSIVVRLWALRFSSALPSTAVTAPVRFTFFWVP